MRVTYTHLYKIYARYKLIWSAFNISSGNTGLSYWNYSRIKKTFVTLCICMYILKLMFWLNRLPDEETKSSHYRFCFVRTHTHTHTHSRQKNLQHAKCLRVCVNCISSFELHSRKIIFPSPRSLQHAARSQVIYHFVFQWINSNLES